jgi:hypothetical protein
MADTKEENAIGQRPKGIFLRTTYAITINIIAKDTIKVITLYTSEYLFPSFSS